MLEMGDAKSTSLAESQCAKGSGKAVNSADHKIYFKVRRLFLFPISKQNKNLGFSQVKSGNPDTSRYFVLSDRSAEVSDYTANFSQTKKSQLAGLRFFFFPWR